MEMSPSSFDVKNSTRTTSLWITIGILTLLFAVPLFARASFASSGASISLSYTVKTTGSGTVIAVTVSARDSQFPGYVNVYLSSYYNGASSPFNTQKVTVAVSASGSAVQGFAVPYKGSGNYFFASSVTTTSGSVICQASIDPFIKSGH